MIQTSDTGSTSIGSIALASMVFACCGGIYAHATDTSTSDAETQVDEEFSEMVQIADSSEVTGNEATSIEEHVFKEGVLSEDLVFKAGSSDGDNVWTSVGQLESQTDLAESELQEEAMMEWYNSQRQRVQSLQNAEYPESPEAKKTTVNEALAIIERFYNYKLVPHAVNVTEDGHILLEFADDSSYDSVEMAGDGFILHTKMHSDHGVKVRQHRLNESIMNKLGQSISDAYPS